MRASARKRPQKPGSQKLRKSFVPKNNRIPKPLFYHLVELSAVRTKLYLLALANRRIPKRQGCSRVATFPLRTKTKLSHIVQMAGAHGYVVLKPRASVSVIVRASKAPKFLSMLVVTIEATLNN
jgi:hypothetical protein